MNDRELKALQTIRRARSSAALGNSSRYIIDPNTGNTWNDPISLEPIPRKYMVALKGQPYNARSLINMIKKMNFKIPHTRQVLDNDEIFRIVSKLPNKNAHVIVDPSMKRKFVSSMKSIRELGEKMYESIPSKNTKIPMFGLRYKILSNSNISSSNKAFAITPLTVIPGVHMTGVLRVKPIRSKMTASMNMDEFETTNEKIGVILETMVTMDARFIKLRFSKNYSKNNKITDLAIFLLTFKKAYFEVTQKNAMITANKNISDDVSDIIDMINSFNF